MATINFDALAEFFPPKSRRFRNAPLAYKRFERAADAVRYAIEELPSDLLLGAFLEVEEERFDGKGIRALYDSPDYPLPRRAPEAAEEKPAAAEAVAAKPVAGKPVAAKPVAAKPVAAKPVAAKPAAAKPVAGKPVVGQPAGKAVAGKAVAGKTVAGQPAGTKPAGAKPVGAKPIAGKTANGAATRR